MADKVEITPVYVEYTPPIQLMKENHLYISKKRSAVEFFCFGGCHTVIVLDLKPHFKKGFDLIDKNGKISIQPSKKFGYSGCSCEYRIIDNIVTKIK